MAGENRVFQAEVSRLLDIVAHSLYSEKRIFLRELISNAADACDRLRYVALTAPELLAGEPVFRIVLSVDRGLRTLTIADTGIGMNHDDLVENMGTIARSGTAEFVSRLSGDARKDVGLIGQFGVGFYSAFMVADRVEVTSRKAGESQAWRWYSEGKGEFSVAEASDKAAAGLVRGTRVVLHLRPEDEEFLDIAKLREVVKAYSDHVAVPIALIAGGKEETINAASALWTRPKSEITPDQYKEFYHHVGHAFDDPALVMHWRAEGTIEYSALLFVPSVKPFDLFHPERKHQLKLYVKRVFITDKCEGLAPGYLRFLRGVVDSEDLPLNVSREMLQHNPVLAKIRSGLVHRVLGELERKAKTEEEDYLKFWENFGPVLKEGLYEDASHRDPILELCRFRSTASEAWTTLADYVSRLRPGQECLYYAAGDDLAQLQKSPHLEGFRARGVEVMLFADPIDEFWVQAVGKFKGKDFRSVTRGAPDLDKIQAIDGAAPQAKPEEPSAELSALIALFRLTLEQSVKDVRISKRLTDSPVCLVADEGDLDIHIERMLRQHKQGSAAKRILEINPGHPLILRLAGRVGKAGAGDMLTEMAHHLVDQARIVEGEPLPDPAAFSRRLAVLLEKGIG